MPETEEEQVRRRILDLWDTGFRDEALIASDQGVLRSPDYVRRILREERVLRLDEDDGSPFFPGGLE